MELEILKETAEAIGSLLDMDMKKCPICGRYFASTKKGFFSDKCKCQKYMSFGLYFYFLKEKKFEKMIRNGILKKIKTVKL